ncbi:MAG: plasmid recombination protein, partial [Oscillospiraceae bacterium]|nr:plasmid recombination protein [Oscillospiraceae bacterium]
YHLHVVYIPVVEKKVYFRKNNKNPELAGKLREVITQVSHCKKWPRDRDENGRWINSYSLLQDRYFEHMKAAGFMDFERGERGSTAEHLSVIEFKTKAEMERITDLTVKAEEKEREIVVLDEKADNRKKFIERQNERITVNKKAIATIEQIDGMGKSNLISSGYNFTVDETLTLKTLAKRSVKDRKTASDMKKERDKAVAELTEVKKKVPSIKDSLNFGKFLSALKRAPKRLMQVIEDILHSPPERSGAEIDLNVNKRKSFDIPR